MDTHPGLQVLAHVLQLAICIVSQPITTVEQQTEPLSLLHSDASSTLISSVIKRRQPGRGNTLSNINAEALTAQNGKPLIPVHLIVISRSILPPSDIEYSNHSELNYMTNLRYITGGLFFSQPHKIRQGFRPVSGMVHSYLFRWFCLLVLLISPFLVIVRWSL